MDCSVVAAMGGAKLGTLNGTNNIGVAVAEPCTSVGVVATAGVLLFLPQVHDVTTI